MGFFSFETAWRTLRGYEAMNMLRKGHEDEVEKEDSMKQVFEISRPQYFSQLFATQPKNLRCCTVDVLR